MIFNNCFLENLGNDILNLISEKLKPKDWDSKMNMAKLIKQTDEKIQKIRNTVVCL